MAVVYLQQSTSSARQTARQHLDVWNIADVVQFTLLIGTAVLHFTVASHAVVSKVAGCAVLVHAINTLFFAQGFPQTGPLIRMIYKITVDMGYFLLVLFFVLIGLTFFYYSVAQPNLIGGGGVWMVAMRMYTVFLLGAYDPSDFELDGENDVILTSVVLVLMSLFTSIIMLNLLIALMGESFANIKARENEELALVRAGVIVEVEQYLSKGGRTDERFPNILHVLKPTREVKAKLDFPDVVRQMDAQDKRVEEQFKSAAEQLEKRLQAVEQTIEENQKKTEDNQKKTEETQKKMEENQKNILAALGQLMQDKGVSVVRRSSQISRRSTKYQGKPKPKEDADEFGFGTGQLEF